MIILLCNLMYKSQCVILVIFCSKIQINNVDDKHFKVVLYGDNIWAFFDHLLPYIDIFRFSTFINVEKNWHFWTSYLLVNKVCEHLPSGSSYYVLDVLWGQPIKLIQVASNSELREN